MSHDPTGEAIKPWKADRIYPHKPYGNQQVPVALGNGTPKMTVFFKKVLWEAGSRLRESMLLTGTRYLPFKWNFCDFHKGLWGPFTSGTVFLTFSSQLPRGSKLPKLASSVISSRNLLCPTPHPFPFPPYLQAELTAETQLFTGACDGLCP